VILYYVFILSLPLISHSIFAREVGGMTVSQYLGLACFLYALFVLGGRRRPVGFLATTQARCYLWLYALALLSYAASLLGPNPGRWRVVVLFTSQLVFFITTLILVDSLDRLRKVLLVAIGSMALGSLYMLREWWGGSTVYGAEYRPGYVTGDPNFFAASALLCLPLAFGWALEGRRRWERMYCLGCLLLGLAASMVAASRGGFLGLLIALGVFVWHSRYRARAMTLVPAALALFLLVSPSSPVRRLFDPTPGDLEARNARFELWSAGLKMVGSHPLLGVGLGNFKSMAGRYSGLGPDLQLLAHNGYLDVAAEVGLPALAALLGILYYSYRTAARVRRQTRKEGPLALHHAALGIEAGLVGFAVALIFVSGLFLKLFWLMVFLSMRLPDLQRQARRTQEKAMAA
jgi:putative inorganic carbon (hco3(-)) transporter